MKGATGELESGFKIGDRTKINHYLNLILWFTVIIGPVAALLVKADICPKITYTACLKVSLLAAALSAVHLFLLRRSPGSDLTGLFALAALDAEVVFMSFNQFHIQLAWLMMPLLSMLFCSTVTYCCALGLNYVLMVVTTWFIAACAVDLSAEDGPLYHQLFEELGSATLEMLPMAVAGYIIVKLATEHYLELSRQNEVIRQKEHSEQEKVEILDSIVAIYDNVNLISFVDNTEMSLRDPTRQKHFIDMPTQTHTLMNQRIKKQVMTDQLAEFLTFTNITTVRKRMTHKRVISADFIDIKAGWFRAQYIMVEQAADGQPDVVIYNTRNVDEEKRHEEDLIRLSLTDELTRLYNRRCFEEDLAEYRSGSLGEDFVLFSIDVNGLKAVNDTYGHAAGDELIKAAAECLALAVRLAGKSYRTGGDEFMSIVHTSTPNKLREELRHKAAQWHGLYTAELSLSIGYAACIDHREATVDELERLADADMYAEKERYYAQHQQGRRPHQI